MKKIRNILIGSLFCVILLTAGLVGCGNSVAGTYYPTDIYVDGQKYNIEAYARRMMEGAPEDYIEASLDQYRNTYLKLNEDGTLIYYNRIGSMNDSPDLASEGSWRKEGNSVVVSGIGGEGKLQIVEDTLRIQGKGDSYIVFEKRID